MAESGKKLLPSKTPRLRPTRGLDAQLLKRSPHKPTGFSALLESNSSGGQSGRVLEAPLRSCNGGIGATRAP